MDAINSLLFCNIIWHPTIWPTSLPINKIPLELSQPMLVVDGRYIENVVHELNKLVVFENNLFQTH